MLLLSSAFQGFVCFALLCWPPVAPGKVTSAPYLLFSLISTEDLVCSSASVFSREHSRVCGSCSVNQQHSRNCTLPLTSSLPLKQITIFDTSWFFFSGLLLRILMPLLNFWPQIIIRQQLIHGFGYRTSRRKYVQKLIDKYHKIPDVLFSVLLNTDLRGKCIQGGMGINIFVHYALFYIKQYMISKHTLWSLFCFCYPIFCTYKQC